ncbi:hypothetical protein JHK82_039467 [Glycine max]|nr:hypothetical protein JHK85_040225 [Glycine max]KAG5110244.1 hypothetical protein JHK82_039467 [Glycine max]KAG5121532.1 hypothetical protein JHK84_039872 [Glycine max]
MTGERVHLLLVEKVQKQMVMKDQMWIRRLMSSLLRELSQSRGVEGRHTFDGFPRSLKAKHNGLPKSSPTLSGTRFFPSFLRPAKVSKCSNEERLMLKPKDVPQKISSRHELHKHELDNVVAVTESQPSLRQTPTQAEGETTRTPWGYPFRDSFLS